MDDQIIRDMQYRKGLSIGFFNSLNSAIALCAGMNVHEETTIKRVFELRDLFIEEHKKYYAEVIAGVGLFNPADTIKRLQSVTNLEELRTTWIALSADERQNTEVIQAKNEIKAKYEKE